MPPVLFGDLGGSRAPPSCASSHVALVTKPANDCRCLGVFQRRPLFLENVHLF